MLPSHAIFYNIPSHLAIPVSVYMVNDICLMSLMYFDNKYNHVLYILQTFCYLILLYFYNIKEYYKIFPKKSILKNHNELINKMIIYYPGSFKPPHRGHFSIVEKLLSIKNVQSIIIYISSKSRFCDDKKKEYTAQQSKNIWNFYILNCLSPEKRDKIKIRISYFPSPIYQVYSEIARNKKTKDTQTYSIVKSTKDEGNTRFDLFKKLEQSGYHIEYKVIKELGKLSSTNYRCLLDKIKKITEKNRKDLQKYYPKKIPKNLVSSFEKLLLQ